MLRLIKVSHSQTDSITLTTTHHLTQRPLNTIPHHTHTMADDRPRTRALPHQPLRLAGMNEHSSKSPPPNIPTKLLTKIHHSRHPPRERGAPRAGETLPRHHRPPAAGERRGVRFGGLLPRAPAGREGGQGERRGERGSGQGRRPRAAGSRTGEGEDDRPPVGGSSCRVSGCACRC